jgi:hypothetical protein
LNLHRELIRSRVKVVTKEPVARVERLAILIAGQAAIGGRTRHAVQLEGASQGLRSVNQSLPTSSILFSSALF